MGHGPGRVLRIRLLLIDRPELDRSHRLMLFRGESYARMRQLLNEALKPELSRDFDLACFLSSGRLPFILLARQCMAVGLPVCEPCASTSYLDSTHIFCLYLYVFWF